MTNQPTGIKNLDNNLSAEMPPESRRFYAFADLPPLVQENLRRLQNSPGDFLRVDDYSHTYEAILLVFIVICLFILVVGFAFSMTNLETYIAVPTVGLLFLIWIFYLAHRIYKRMRLPIANHLYLTRTQVIQTRNGIVRYRELKDASGIEMKSTTTTNSGIAYALYLNFDDGDCYRYSRIGKWLTDQRGEALRWRETALRWRESAIKAFERGDAEYFNSQNIFCGVFPTNTPVVKRKTNILPLLVALLLTFSLPIASFVAFGYVNKKIGETERWNYAVSKNTVASYFYYLNSTNTTKPHVSEADQKINAFYGEAADKINAGRRNAYDSQGIETALNLLKNARSRQNSEVVMSITNSSQKINREDFRRKISARFKEIFPADVLSVGENGSDMRNPATSEPLIKIETYDAAEKPKPEARKTSRAAQSSPPPDTKSDFKCTIVTPNKPDYSFELKSATDEDFINELARRFGV